MSEQKTGAAGVAEAVEKVLGKFYPSGIATKVLRKQLEESGFSAKEISNGVYKLTSGGVVERDKEDDCFYLVNDPKPEIAGRQVITPASRPVAVVVEPAVVAPTPIPEAVIQPEEIVVSASEAEPELPKSITALLAVPGEYADLGLEDQQLLAAIRETGALLAQARQRRPVAEVAFKQQVLREIGLQFDDQRLDRVLAEISQDLSDHAA